MFAAGYYISLRQVANKFIKVLFVDDLSVAVSVRRDVSVKLRYVLRMRSISLSFTSACAKR